MSIFKVTPGDIESFTVVTNPFRTFVSSSAGVTGSVNVFARRSSIEKDASTSSAFVDSAHDDVDINSSLMSLQQTGRIARSNTNLQLAGTFPGMISSYMDQVHHLGASSRKNKQMLITRFTPSFTFTENTMRKLVVKDILTKYHRIIYPSAHWAYTNYNSLNFFTASTLPTSSCLMYPNIDGGPYHAGYVSGTYSMSGAFSFDFYINPRYRTDNIDGQFKAGTLLHLSSSYAVSLVTGSSKDENGMPFGYRMKLQLSHSADIVPSLAKNGTYPNDLIFLSDDNSLQWNRWHHVIIRWGTSAINQGTGSFNIDGIDRGTFVIPSSTITPLLYPAGGRSGPDVLCVGNFYEGNNTGFGAQSYFFANDPATREGLQVLNATVAIDEPTKYSFNHPLNAEVHDLSIKRIYMSDDFIAFSASMGPKSLNSDTAFYLPPFFVQNSPFRQWVGTHGGILQTPFFEVNGTTDDPFNVAMSFGVGGHYINIENFLRDFASDVFPLVHHLSASAIPNTTALESANQFLYDDPRVRKRNLLIMPCDDGLFVPSYELLASESNRTKSTDDAGVEELSYINLDNLVSTASLIFGSAFETEGVIATSAEQFVNDSIGFTPEVPGNLPGRAFLGYVNTVNKAVASGTFDAGVQTGAPLTIFQRTRDASSNQMTFFNVSNIFYGKRILPGSFQITDSAITGSSRAMSITLKDDGLGNIYRADCLTSASKWNSVGSIFYDEGVIAIKSPHLYFFGKEQFSISFRGEQNIHVMKLEVIAPANQLNSSSNPNFMDVPASGYKTDTDPEFVYVTSLNFHDENFNVIAKTQLAQPIVKRHGDRIMFKVAFDV